MMYGWIVNSQLSSIMLNETAYLRQLNPLRNETYQYTKLAFLHIAITYAFLH